MKILLTILRLLPATVSSFALGAHFLRRGDMIQFVLCVLLPLLLLVRVPAVYRGLQAFLIGAACVWGYIALQLVQLRLANQMPWHRLALILFGVIAIALLGAALLEPEIRKIKAKPR